MLVFYYFELFPNIIETDMKPYKMFLQEGFPAGSGVVNIF